MAQKSTSSALEQESFLQIKSALKITIGKPLLVNPHCLQFALITDLMTGQREDKVCLSFLDWLGAQVHFLKRILRSSDCLAFNAEWKLRLPVWHSRISFGVGQRRRLGKFGHVSDKDRIQDGSQATKKPTAGGLTQTKTHKGLAWTGRKLKVDWTGFEGMAL